MVTFTLSTDAALSVYETTYSQTIISVMLLRAVPTFWYQYWVHWECMGTFTQYWYQNEGTAISSTEIGVLETGSHIHSVLTQYWVWHSTECVCVCVCMWDYSLPNHNISYCATDGSSHDLISLLSVLGRHGHIHSLLRLEWGNCYQ